MRPSSENYHVGVRNPIVLPLKPRCPDCLPICEHHDYPPLLLSTSPPASLTHKRTKSPSDVGVASAGQCACPHHHHPKEISTHEKQKIAGHVRKHKKQESMARDQITKLIPPSSAQRGGQGNVHKEPVVQVHEGLADKLKNKLMGRKKGPK